MDAFYFIQIVGAVIVANVLTAWFCYSAWRVTRNENMGIKPSRGPFVYLLGMMVPPLLVLATGLLVTV